MDVALLSQGSLRQGSSTGAAPVSPSWTVYQATLVLSGTDVPVVGALVGLNTDGHSVRGLSDATGQVTLALVGQPLFTLGADATLSRSLAVQVTVRLDLPSAALADTEAEINRLAARPAVVSLARQLLTAAAEGHVTAPLAGLLGAVLRRSGPFPPDVAGVLAIGATSGSDILLRLRACARARARGVEMLEP